MVVQYHLLKMGRGASSNRNTSEHDVTVDETMGEISETAAQATIKRNLGFIARGIDSSLAVSPATVKEKSDLS